MLDETPRCITLYVAQVSVFTDSEWIAQILAICSRFSYIIYVVAVLYNTREFLYIVHTYFSDVNFFTSSQGYNTC